MTPPDDARTPIPIDPIPGRPFQVASVYDNPWIRVREDQVIRPDGLPGIYGVVHFKNRAIGVLPVDDDGADLAGRPVSLSPGSRIPGRSPKAAAPRPSLPKRPPSASYAKRPV